MNTSPAKSAAVSGIISWMFSTDPIPRRMKLDSYVCECRVCKREFESGRENAVYCSEECKSTRNRIRALVSYHIRQPAACCASCGQTLINVCFDGKPHYCSSKCERRAR